MSSTSYCCLSPTERTEKVPMGSIKNVVTEPIEGHEDYHMMVMHSQAVLEKSLNS